MSDGKLHRVKDGTRKSKPLPESRIRELYLAGKITTDAVVTQVGTSFGVPVLDFFEGEEQVDTVQLIEDQIENSPEPQMPLFVVIATGKRSRPATPQEILDIYDRGTIEEGATVSDAAGQHSSPIASFLNHYFPGTVQEHVSKEEPTRSAGLKSGGGLMARRFIGISALGWMVWCWVAASSEYQILAEIFSMGGEPDQIGKDTLAAAWPVILERHYVDRIGILLIAIPLAGILGCCLPVSKKHSVDE